MDTSLKPGLSFLQSNSNTKCFIKLGNISGSRKPMNPIERATQSSVMTTLSGHNGCNIPSVSQAMKITAP
jgi:hypothetical protein